MAGGVPPWARMTIRLYAVQPAVPMTARTENSKRIVRSRGGFDELDRRVACARCAQEFKMRTIRAGFVASEAHMKLLVHEQASEFERVALCRALIDTRRRVDPDKTPAPIPIDACETTKMRQRSYADARQI